MDGPSSKRVKAGDNTSIPSNSSNLADEALQLFLYHLESLTHLKQINLQHSLSDIANLDAAIVTVGPQIHLVFHDTSRSHVDLCSKILDVNCAAKGFHLQKVRPGGQVTTAQDCEVSSDLPASGGGDCPAVEYVSMVFHKFSTSPTLMQSARKIDVQVVLQCSSISESRDFHERCARYLSSSIEKIKHDEGKCFSNLLLTVNSDMIDNCASPHVSQLSRLPFGDWVRLLMCMTPIQICRAENKCLRPLRNGVHSSEDVDYADALSLSRVINFGWYDAILTSWPGKIKVVSSMGKQSCGKSYLLNHQSGSLLDVAGGRCTDGVWITMRPSQDCLYVLLDFEGLGSFERSEQEDMLLSIVNAAVSNITIFNQKVCVVPNLYM